MRLYPQLIPSRARSIASELAPLTLPEIERRSSLAHPWTVFTPTGGQKVTEKGLRDLQHAIRGIARKHGYSYEMDDGQTEPLRRGATGDFDADLA